MKKYSLILAILLGLSTIAEAQEEPPFNLGELEAYSVFVDAYRTGDYDLAIDYGQWIIESTPREIEGHDGFSLETQFDRMIEIYVKAAENSDDPSTSSEYYEKAENVFFRAFDTFSEDEIDMFDWNIKMGRFYHENHENIDAGVQSMVERYEKAYNLNPIQFTEMDDGFYARVLLTQYATNGESDKALEMIDEIEPQAGYELTETINEVRESLFEGPEDRIEFFESRIENAEEDERKEMLAELVDLYDEVGEVEKAADAALQVYNLEPDYINTRKLADIYVSEGDYREALQFLEEAMELAESDENRKELALEIAETYQQLENLESARDYALKAIEIDPEWGAPYMRMAAIYAGAISQCTGGETLEREDRTVYWLVLDYLEKAEQADPALSSSVQDRSEAYTEAMPSSEDKFFSDWEEGEPFQIDGGVKECYAWINETTTIR